MTDNIGAETSGVVYELPPASPELRRLDPLIGTWRGSGHTIGSEFGPRMEIDGIESFWWLKGGYFLVSDYRISWGGSQPPDEGIMYWGYDDEIGGFATYFFNDQGPFTVEHSRYVGIIADDAITFTGPARFRLPLDADGKVAVDGEGGIDVAWFLRDEAGDWKPWRTHRYTR
jgi:uncharacterized protein DUF1579